MQLKLTHTQARGDNVYSFQFEPSQQLDWIAGQFLRVRLQHPNPDEKGTNRWFTIAAAPHENRPTITTRITNSTFKQALSRVAIGGTLEMIEAPAGDFTWRPGTKPHLFAAQGIGITPFYAIIKDRVQQREPINATLVYGHQPNAAIIFEPEFTSWAASDPTFQIIYAPGTLTPATLAQLVPDLHERFIYVSGPKSFIGLALPPHNIPLSRIKQDNFPGYSAANY